MTVAVLVVVAAAGAVVVLVVELVVWPPLDLRFVVGFGSSDELVAAVVVAALVSSELGLWLSESLGSLVDLVSL